MPDVLVSFFLTVAAGIVTALLAVHLALRRFRTERWWERQAQAYADLISALFDVQRYCRLEVRRVEQGGQFADDYGKDLNARANAGFAEIRKAAALGTFVFGPDTARRLEQLEQQLDDPHYNEDFYEEVTAHLHAVTGALKDLKLLSKKDLSLPR